MIKITFPDGAVREYPYGSTALDIAKSISEGLARKVLAANVNGLVWDATRPILEDSTLKLLTWSDTEGKSTFWHSSAHLLAEAVESPTPNETLIVQRSHELADAQATTIRLRSLAESRILQVMTPEQRIMLREMRRQNQALRRQANQQQLPGRMLGQRRQALQRNPNATSGQRKLQRQAPKR